MQSRTIWRSWSLAHSDLDDPDRPCFQTLGGLPEGHAHPLTDIEGSQATALQDGCVDEYVLSATVHADEAEAAYSVIPLHATRSILLGLVPGRSGVGRLSGPRRLSRHIRRYGNDLRNLRTFGAWLDPHLQSGTFRQAVAAKRLKTRYVKKRVGSVAQLKKTEAFFGVEPTHRGVHDGGVRRRGGSWAGRLSLEIAWLEPLGGAVILKLAASPIAMIFIFAHRVTAYVG